MARSRSLAHYPAVYWEIIENIGKGGKEFVIEQESRPMALKLQGHFYAFIGALRRTAAQANLRGQEPVNQRIIDCAAMSQVILVQVESMADGRARVHIRHREQSWQAAAFAAGKFVEDAPPAEVEAKIEASKQELLKKLGMTGDSKK